MKNITDQELLKNRKVVEEINRHLWIESEKAGYDIGFDSAAVDWLEKFSKAWMNYHMPKQKIKNPSKAKNISENSASKVAKSKSKHSNPSYNTEDQTS